MTKPLTRRGLMTALGAGAGGLALSGCNQINRNDGVKRVLGSAEGLTMRVQRLITDPKALAREYSPDQMSPRFRTNGNTIADTPEYRRHMQNNFADWRLKVDGLVDRELSLSLAQLRKGPNRTQITRHDCVEGWSAIGQWTGIKLSAVLNSAGLKEDARYIVFHCADTFGANNYYESIDLVDAFHPQTILAYGMNGGDLPVGHGAPIRLRVERQLGYKHAKFIMRIEAVNSLKSIGLGKGGFWEDRGNYAWYAGI